ncbi:MAG: hypothetical protein IPK52_13925 [Chloroflexi bacterium]|nr:hypothetical protein [Chloroflexota bacterium]
MLEWGIACIGQIFERDGDDAAELAFGKRGSANQTIAAPASPSSSAMDAPQI